MRCPNCKCMVPGSMNFCSYCGYMFPGGGEKTLTIDEAYRQEAAVNRYRYVYPLRDDDYSYGENMNMEYGDRVWYEYYEEPTQDNTFNLLVLFCGIALILLLVILATLIIML